MDTATQTTKPEAAEAGRLRGFIRETKTGGYGFIRTDDRLDFFFHISDLQPQASFKSGVTVEFTPVANTAPNKCDRAVKVKELA